MRFSIKYIIVIAIIILAILLLTAKTEIKVCEVCGVQDYERSLFGKTIEFISEREIDELGTYAKWRQENDTIHTPHIWKEIDPKTRDLLTH